MYDVPISLVPVAMLPVDEEISSSGLYCSSIFS